VPKLLLQHPDELALLVQAGVSPAAAPALVRVLGVVEIALGLALLLAWRSRRLLLATIALMLLATAGVAWTSPTSLVDAFNPLTLNLAVAVLALVGYLAGAELPSARRCLRKRPEGG